MLLEARSANCFSSTFVLKKDGRPVGTFEGRWFSESVDVYLTQRRHLVFEKVSWLGSRFELVDEADKAVLARGDRSGLFTSSWDLHTSAGDGQLVKGGWFVTGYDFVVGKEVWASVDRVGLCERGWTVAGHGPLTEEDLLLIGLVYHTVQQRESRRHHAGPHAAGS
jgi:hypothetical protein